MTISSENFEEWWKQFAEKTGAKKESTKQALKEVFDNAFNDSEGQLKICHADCIRMVSFQNAHRGIPSLVKEIAKSQQKKDSFLMISNYANNLSVDEKIISQKLLRDLGWEGFTYGDFLLKCLDCLVCMGKISKVRFCRGRPGHVYQKQEHICPFSDMIIDRFGTPQSYTCRLDWNNGVIIRGRFPESKVKE